MRAKPKKQIIEEVVNTHDQLIRWKEAGLAARPVAVCKSYISGGRGPAILYGWEIYSPWEQTDSEVHWQHYGRKQFPNSMYYREVDRFTARKLALAAALGWANAKYGPFDWVRNRMGDYVPKELNDYFPLRKQKRKAGAV